MAQKNNLARFTVQFNPADPCHQQTIDILNQQGRRKAQFIVNAIMHYLNCSETPNVSSSSIDTALIEGVVRRIVEEKLNSTPKTLSEGIAPQRKIHKSESISIEAAQDIVGEKGMDAIERTMASFRR